MKIRLLRISNFRGFEQLELKPREHVLLVGEPGAGRSDLVVALWRVLSPDSTRSPLSEDYDFFNRDLSRRIEVEVVLGELGDRLEQAFLDRLELWDIESGQLVEELDLTADTGEDGKDSVEYAVRLCYRAVWDPEQQQAKQWVDFPKYSDPEGEDFRTVPRLLREELPVAFVVPNNSPLSLGSRGSLRQLVEAGEQTDFSSALDRLMDGIAQLAEDLVQSADLVNVLERILEPLRTPLGIDDTPAANVIRFAPEGGSLAGVLRGLRPTMKLRDTLGFLPLTRHGSTLSALLQLSQAIAQENSADAVVVVDDFGENIDVDAARHMAGVLRSRAGQLWLSTRRGPVGQCFRPEEVVRLTTSDEGKRCANIGRVPLTKPERLASRHLHLQILPAVSSRSVLIVEGPHDRAVLSAIDVKLNIEEGIPLLAAQRMALLDAGAAEGSGGIAAIPRLASLARQLGFYVVVLIDWDRDEETSNQRLGQNLENAHTVIRWPKGCAIEKALLSGLDDGVIRSALEDVKEALSVPLGFDPNEFSGDQLVSRSIKFLKSSGGLHVPFVDALPNKCVPPLLRKCAEEIRQALSKPGLIQL